MNKSVNPINRRISIYRGYAGYTQQQAADLLGMKKNTYARMERYGNPTPDMLTKLASLYNVSLNMLLYGNDEGRLPLKHIETSITGTLNQEPQLLLTIDEQNCVRMCRGLPKSMQKMVMDFISSLYEELKKQNEE